MHRVPWTLKLQPGTLEADMSLHDAIWTEMAALIRTAGISDFRICRRGAASGASQG